MFSPQSVQSEINSSQGLSSWRGSTLSVRSGRTLRQVVTIAPGRLQVCQEELDELIGVPSERARPTGLTTARWPFESTTICVPVHAVLPTQRVKAEWVNEYLSNPLRMSHCGDLFGHIVVDGGRWLIEDGHHRWAATVVAGKQWWPSRVFVLDQ